LYRNIHDRLIKMVSQSCARVEYFDRPADFESQRTSYYQALNLPLEADQFVVGLQEEMRKALHTFDTGLARNPRVRINEKAGGWISVTPLTAQPEPTNLAALKALWEYDNIIKSSIS
jgi:hypothetical protein